MTRIAVFASSETGQVLILGVNGFKLSRSRRQAHAPA
jgi:hypothetical protein